MRNWIDLIVNEGRAPEAPLMLYWILPDGGIHDTVATCHEDEARKLLGIKGKSGTYVGSRAATKAGWIRVAAISGEFGADISKHVGKSALRSLDKLIADTSYEYPVYYINDVRCAGSKEARQELIRLRARLDGR